MSFIKRGAKGMADVIPGLGKFTYDTELGTIFITSGTGVIGYRVALSLLEAGHKNVRVGVWKGDRQLETSGGDKSLAQKVEEVLTEKGADVIDFDWADPAGYKDAVAGCKTVFCTIPHMENWAEAFPNFLTTCKETKVEHFIKVSFLRKTKSIGMDAAEQYRDNVPFVKFHATCDDLLEQAPRTSRISYTILCASHLMSTPLLSQGPLIRDEKKFVTASYGMGVNYVSPNDVADACIVTIMDRKKHRNQIYNLTGAGPTTDAQVAKLLGSDIEHVQLGYHDYKKSIKKRGLPSWLVRDAAEMERMKASGIDELTSSYTEDLQMLIGKEPEDFKDYLLFKSSMRPGLTFP